MPPEPPQHIVNSPEKHRGENGVASMSHPGAVLPQITFPVLAKVRTRSKVRRFYGNFSESIGWGVGGRRRKVLKAPLKPY